MNLFAVVVPWDRAALPEYKEALTQAITDTIPFAQQAHQQVVWDNGHVLAASFSIHGATVPIKAYAASTDREFCTFNGVPYVLESQGEPWAEVLLRRLSAGSLDVATLGGYYNLLHVQGDQVSAWNCVTRIEPIYWVRNEHCMVIGNRASLVQALALRSTAFRYQPIALLSMTTAGWLAHDLTPFEGVEVLQVGQQIKIEGDRVSFISYKPYEFVEIPDPSPEQIDQLSHQMLEQLMAGIKLISTFSKRIWINLSGGKDSRIMAAICARAGIDFYCVTSGAPEDREVIVASEVAQILGVEHQTSSRPPASTEIPQVDIFGMIRQHIAQSDGMLNIFDPIYPVRLQPNVLLNGHGGECLRGGYERLWRPLIESREMAATFFKHLNLHNKDIILRPDAIERQEEINKNIVEAYFQTAFPLENFYDYIYTVYREGRGISNIRQAAAYGAFAFSPFLNDNLLRLGWQLPLAMRRDDRLYYQLLLRLHPQLAHHRFSDSRWKFEADGPGPETSQEDWLKRAPLPPSPPVQGAHHWRMGYDDYLRPIVRDYLLQNRSNPVYEFIDIGKLEKVLDQEPPTTYGVMQSVFGILTAAYFLSEDWRRPMQGA